MQAITHKVQTTPSDGVFGRYNHDYARLPHSHAHHISIEPQDVDSVHTKQIETEANQTFRFIGLVHLSL